MPVPNVRVTDVTAGLVRLQHGVVHEIPDQPFSSIYLPETGPVWVGLGDRPAFRVEKGGLCTLPKGLAHTVCSYVDGKGRRGTLEPPFSHVPPAGDGPLVFTGRVPAVANPLPDIMPDAVVLTAGQMAGERQLDLVFQLIRSNVLVPQEDRTQITHRLVEVAAIIILEYVLRHLKSDGLNAAQGIGDPQIRRALLAIHERPEEEWTLESLARHAGLSRSVFAQRFKTLLDQTPVDYLTRIRMARATRLLRSRELSVSEIAFRCGYKSDGAFHKAFKRLIGMSPREYRREHARA